MLVFKKEMINLGVVEFLEKFTYVDSNQVIRETLWAISNILSGPRKHIEYVIKKTNFFKSFEKFSQDKDSDVKIN